MSEWKDARLGEFAEINMGQSPKSEFYNSTGEGLPFLQGNRTFGFRNPKIDTFCTDCKKIAEKNSILFSVRAPVGDTNIAHTKICIGRGLASLNAYNKENNYLFYLLIFLKEIIVNSETGSVFGSINKTDLHNIPFRRPPLPEQKAIAEVLSSLDDKIDLLGRQNKTLEEMAETLFIQWFIEERDESWEEVVLGAAIQPKKGKNITKTDAIDGPYPVIAGGLSPSCFHIKSNTLAPVITISASGANAGYVQLHHTPVWSSDSSYIDNNITRYVYFHYVFLKINQGLIFDKQEGSAQPHIYPKHIMELEYVNVPENLLLEYENIVSNYFSKIKVNIKQINTLENMRDNLLPKLMSGEVRIKNAITGV